MPAREPRPSGGRGLRLASLALGALALFMMTGWVMTDWVYDEGTLPPEGAPAFVIGAVAWLVALMLALTRRAVRATAALAATPVLVAALWTGSAGAIVDAVAL